MNGEVFSFIIYMIHELADSWHMLPGEVFYILKDSGCIDNYLIPYYDVLHTLDTDYLVYDINKYLENRRITI